MPPPQLALRVRTVDTTFRLDNSGRKSPESETTTKLQLLYIDDCPSWERGLGNLEAALESEGIHAEVDLIKIRDVTEATRFKFLGSPSFRVDGQELWPEEREINALSCRIYQSTQGAKGWPSVEMLREKLPKHGSNI